MMIVKREAERGEPTKFLYPYQQTSVEQLLAGKKILYAGMGLGKNPISMVWSAEKCRLTGKHKILVISTPSKVRTSDHEDDMKDFVGATFYNSLDAFEKTSWHQLYKWVWAHKKDLNDWVVVADEIQRMKAGAGSRMGKSFLHLVSHNEDWAGFTGTPGDRFIDLYAYFQASGLVRSKTQFLQRFCVIQTFKGFPEIIGYREESVLKRWWAQISYAPDTHRALSELPSEQHRVVYFPKPKGYEKVLKMRQKLCSDGTLSEDYDDFLDNPSKTFQYLRQLCFTKEKQDWLKDFFSDLGEGAVVFYNYRATGNTLEEIAQKALPEGAKVWRIDGSHHEIPTAETIGPRDIVLCQWQSGSEALNLQFLRVWVSVELTYSFSTASQARGRIKRIGQKRSMLFFYLQTKDTIEEDVLKCLHDKSDFSEAVWGIGKGLIKKGEKYEQ